MSRELTDKEQQELKKLHAIIDQAVADGVLTAAERHQITATMREDGKITFEELEMIRTLVCDKVAAGELDVEC
jgi:uncharacterized protein YqhQ